MAIPNSNTFLVSLSAPFFCCLVSFLLLLLSEVRSLHASKSLVISWDTTWNSTCLNFSTWEFFLEKTTHNKLIYTNISFTLRTMFNLTSHRTCKVGICLSYFVTTLSFSENIEYCTERHNFGRCMDMSVVRKNANDVKRHTNLSCLYGLMGSIHFGRAKWDGVTHSTWTSALKITFFATRVICKKKLVHALLKVECAGKTFQALLSNTLEQRYLFCVHNSTNMSLDLFVCYASAFDFVRPQDVSWSQ